MVVVVRLPLGGGDALAAALGRPFRPEGDQGVPAIVQIASDVHDSELLAAALRNAGAEVVVMEEASVGRSLCASHTAQITAHNCTACGTAICPGCRLDAKGELLCGSCSGVITRRARNTRLRQLVVVFAFAVFLFQLSKFMLREQELLDPSGPIDVAIYQFVRPEAAKSPLIRQLNSAHPDQSLRAIAAWYTQEHARYTGDSSPYLHLTVHGPWVTDVHPPPLADADAAWWRILLQGWRYPRYFHALARDHDQDPDAHGARVYVIYGNERGDLAADSRGSRKGRIAVSFIPVNTSSIAYAQETIAHELTHILGASDLYDPDTYLAQYPQGFVQPWARPPFPQRYAEIMAVDVPDSPATEHEITSLHQARIGYRTAADIGWITKEQADLYYTPESGSADAMLGPPPPPVPDPVEPPVSPELPFKTPLPSPIPSP